MPTIRIPTPLRKLTNEQEVVQASGSDIETIIADLDKNFPGLKDRICDEAGNVRRFVNIFVNDEERSGRDFDCPSHCWWIGLNFGVPQWHFGSLQT